MKPRESLAEQIEEAVNQGTTGAEEIHRAIADLPFEVLARNDLLVARAAELRAFQQESIGAVYDLVRRVTHSVGELASDLIEDRAVEVALERLDEDRDAEES